MSIEKIWLIDLHPWHMEDEDTYECCIASDVNKKNQNECSLPFVSIRMDLTEMVLGLACLWNSLKLECDRRRTDL